MANTVSGFSLFNQAKVTVTMADVVSASRLPGAPLVRCHYSLVIQCCIGMLGMCNSAVSLSSLNEPFACEKEYLWYSCTLNEYL